MQLVAAVSQGCECRGETVSETGADARSPFQGNSPFRTTPTTPVAARNTQITNKTVCNLMGVRRRASLPERAAGRRFGRSVTRRAAMLLASAAPHVPDG